MGINHLKLEFGSLTQCLQRLSNESSTLAKQSHQSSVSYTTTTICTIICLCKVLCVGHPCLVSPQSRDHSHCSHLTQKKTVLLVCFESGLVGCKTILWPWQSWVHHDHSDQKMHFPYNSIIGKVAAVKLWIHMGITLPLEMTLLSSECDRLGPKTFRKSRRAIWLTLTVQGQIWLIFWEL